MYQILLFLSYYQIVSRIFKSFQCLSYQILVQSFILSYNPPFWIKFKSTLSEAFNGSCINSLSAFSNLRGLLSYYLIVLFSYFQSLGRFLGALYHIIIGLFWGAFSYYPIIIGPLFGTFYPIVLLSLDRFWWGFFLLFYYHLVCFWGTFFLLFYYHWACCGEYFQMALSMHLGGIFNLVFIALSMILVGIFNQVFSALSMDVGDCFQKGFRLLSMDVLGCSKKGFRPLSMIVGEYYQ